MSRSPSNIGSQKRDQLVSTAWDLFMRFGIRRVTVQEICTTAKVSKMTFYHYFKNKLDLVHHIVDQLIDEGMKAFDEIMSMSIPMEEKMEKVIHYKIEVGRKFSGEFFNELYGEDPNITSHMRELASEVQKKIRADFSRAQMRGEIRRDLNLDFFMYAIDKIYDWVYDPKLREIFPDHLELINEMTRVILFGVMDSPQHEA